MGGWRDTEGRTRPARRQQEQAAQRARLADTVKRRPLSLLRPALFGLFVLVVIAALVLR